jgi:RimJ/RimL family protein N-acetyltransferase
MAETALDVQLRPATLDDAPMVADLESLRDPTDERDPPLLRHWWAVADATERVSRRVAEQGGAAIAYLGAGHDPRRSAAGRFGWVKPVLRNDVWAEGRFDALLELGEEWLRAEGVKTAIFRTRDSVTAEIEVARRRGYLEARRSRLSELDLVQRRDHIKATAEKARELMATRGVRLLTVDEDGDPDKLPKLHAMMLESERDIPTTAPLSVLSLGEWKLEWFGNPSIREDRFWIAREGDDIVGMSVLGYPVERGVPWTSMTGTARRVRGRGIARAVKYQSIEQAVELGFARVRTNNDGDNAPILHLNDVMGYRPLGYIVELHRELSS